MELPLCFLNLWILGQSIQPGWIELSVISLIKTVVVVAILLGLVSYTVMAERRISAAIQDRIGPNRTGIPLTNIRLWGLGQPIADAIKFLLKEQYVPGNVNKLYYWLAPALAMMPAIITIAAIPYASLEPLVLPLSWVGLGNITVPYPGVIAPINTGVLFILAITSLSVYGIVLGGWASNSKYPFLGGIRSSAQMISYEVCLGLSLIPVFMVIGHLNLSEIIEWQIRHGWLLFPVGAPEIEYSQLFLLPSLWLSFIIFLVSAFAETNRLPFDLPESETELVGGYHTEYSGMKFALFFLGEYAAMIVTSCLMVTLFFGGWSLPFSWFLEWQGTWLGFVTQALVFLAKMAVFLFFFIWVRWTLPRFRYDQLMHIGWKVFLPLSLLNVVAVAFLLAFLS